MLYELQGVVREHQGRRILDLPELTIEKGKIYSLVGANGAGKTTLLNLLAFLDRPNAGRIRFCGEAVTRTSAGELALRRRVVLVDQYPILFTGPVWKSVEYGMKVRGCSRTERETRVREVLELVGMQAFIDAEAGTLSGGETKRVALAMALAVRPEVLLCDEPAANVDHQNQEIISDILRHINGEEQTSIIFSTHYLAQGRQLADHRLVLDRGRLVPRPNENIYHCQRLETVGGMVRCRLNNQVEILLGKDRLPADTDHFQVVLDPEKLNIAAAGDGLERSITGRIVHLQKEGEQVRVSVVGQLGVELLLPMAEYLRLAPRIDEEVGLSIPAESLCIYQK